MSSSRENSSRAYTCTVHGKLCTCGSDWKCVWCSRALATCIAGVINAGMYNVGSQVAPSAQIF
jgi:hypothetical protein